MKILVMGTGGIGGYYGGLLANQGNDVTFIARGAHLEAIRANGLQVKSIHGDFNVSPAQVTDDPAEVGPVDLILFCVKTYHTDEATQAIRPAVEAPGIIKQISQFRRIVLGELDGRKSERIQRIYEVLKNTGITVEIADNILQTLWT